MHGERSVYVIQYGEGVQGEMRSDYLRFELLDDAIKSGSHLPQTRRKNGIG